MNRYKITKLNYALQDVEYMMLNPDKFKSIMTWDSWLELNEQRKRLLNSIWKEVYYVEK